MMLTTFFKSCGASLWIWSKESKHYQWVLSSSAFLLILYRVTQETLIRKKLGCCIKTMHHSILHIRCRAPWQNTSLLRYVSHLTYPIFGYSLSWSRRDPIWVTQKNYADHNSLTELHFQRGIPKVFSTAGRNVCSI